MAKKKEIEMAYDVALPVQEPVEQKVSKLDLEFGRADLNKLKDKVNEIIDNL